MNSETLHIGRRLRLTHELHWVDAGVSTKMSPYGYYVQPRLVDGGDEEIRISGRGLQACYGIFGSPGSGKTQLMLRLLRDVLQIDCQSSDEKWGGLILDPKGALRDRVRALLRDARRAEEDLLILHPDELCNLTRTVRIIPRDLAPEDLAYKLVMAGRQAGVEASESYWFHSWTNLFADALTVLMRSGDLPTLRELVDAVTPKRALESLRDGEIPEAERSIIATALDLMNARESESVHDERLQRAFSSLLAFSLAEKREQHVVDVLIRRAYGTFLDERFECFSPQVQPATSIYDEILDDGRVVLVTASPTEPVMAKVLCTLVKCCFQHAVLARRSSADSIDGPRRKRSIFMACDEYASVASEIPGAEGDGDFFQKCREFNCLGLLATQSVNSLRYSSLGESWRSVASVFGAKIFMRALDPETVEELQGLVGTRPVVASAPTRMDKNDRTTPGNQIITASVVPVELHVSLATGEGVLIGSTDGGASPSEVSLFRVPPDAATRPRTDLVRSCQNCEHRVSPRERKLDLLAKRNSDARHVENKLDAIELEERKSSRAGAHFMKEPRSLAWCELFTQLKGTGEFVVCEDKNPNDDCEMHSEQRLPI